MDKRAIIKTALKRALDDMGAAAKAARRAQFARKKSAESEAPAPAEASGRPDAPQVSDGELAALVG